MTHILVLPGGGYAVHVQNEEEPIVAWLDGLGYDASTLRYPLNVEHPAPLNAVRQRVRALREAGEETVGVVGFSAGGHLAGHAALTGAGEERIDFAILGYAITSMELDTYIQSQDILLGVDPSPSLRRDTSLEYLVTPEAPPFFLWHTAEDKYVPAEHTYRLAAALSRLGLPHTTHVFPHGSHSLGLAKDAGQASTWTALAAEWLEETVTAGR